MTVWLIRNDHWTTKRSSKAFEPLSAAVLQCCSPGPNSTRRTAAPGHVTHWAALEYFRTVAYTMNIFQIYQNLSDCLSISIEHAQNRTEPNHWTQSWTIHSSESARLVKAGSTFSNLLIAMVDLNPCRILCGKTGYSCCFNWSQLANGTLLPFWVLDHAASETKTSLKGLERTYIRFVSQSISKLFQL